MTYIGIKAADISVSIDNQLIVEDGDFVITPSEPVQQGEKQYMLNACDQRCTYDTIVSSIGIWRRTPLLGVDIYRFLNGPITPNSQALLAAKIRENIETGRYFKVLELQMTDPIQIQVKRLKQ